MEIYHDVKNGLKQCPFKQKVIKGENEIINIATVACVNCEYHEDRIDINGIYHVICSHPGSLSDKIKTLRILLND
jgi:hypothetical protein